MLSKSAARMFFLVGTGLCSTAFILLTVDTVAQFDKRTHADKLTDEVKHGFEIYTNNNCMGCHTLLGEGAYYAPELTHVYKRRGPAWIKSFLQDPESFFPGRRKMVKYDFFDPAKDPQAEQNLSDMVAFFQWVQEINSNGFPFEPDLAPAAGSGSPAASLGSSTSMAEAPPIFSSLCLGCHQLGGVGAAVGPALDGVGTRLTNDYLTNWLRDPQKVKPGSKMPALGLQTEQIAALVQFLSRQN